MHGHVCPSTHASPRLGFPPPCSDRVFLLNRFTQLISFWQENKGVPLEEAEAAFPDIMFQG